VLSRDLPKLIGIQFKKFMPYMTHEVSFPSLEEPKMDPVPILTSYLKT
jgi:hypothetical protein